MFIQIGTEITLDEFICLCNRRGFNLVEQTYLQNMMKYIGLIKWANI